jgi:hypothetical protein
MYWRLFQSDAVQTRGVRPAAPPEADRMTPEAARKLSPGDPVQIGPFRGTVERVDSYAGPLGSRGPLVVDIEWADGGKGRISGDWLNDLEALPRSAPDWYGNLMEPGEKSPFDQ